MKPTNYPGLDYSGLGATCNRDPDTGIRYGVISQHSVTPYFWDDVEHDYGEPRCPHCGGKVLESSNAEVPNGDRANKDYYCPKCVKSLWSEDCFPEEAITWSYEKAGYRLHPCLDSDIFISLSPYYTYAQFCSPCVPGACNLDNPFETVNPMTDNYPAWGEDWRKAAEDAGFHKCFCLGHGWFEGDKAPYPVFRVDNNEQVKP